MRQQLIAGIYEAFNGVVLGTGVSLHETVVLDQFGQNERYMALREQARIYDELVDLTKLVGNKDFSRLAPFALTGLDGIGMRYYTPPCLITILDEELPRDSPIFVPLIRNVSRITECSNWCLFSSPQLEITRDCLIHLIAFIDTFWMQCLQDAIESVNVCTEWKT